MIHLAKSGGEDTTPRTSGTYPSATNSIATSDENAETGVDQSESTGSTRGAGSEPHHQSRSGLVTFHDWIQSEHFSHLSRRRPLDEKVILSTPQGWEALHGVLASSSDSGDHDGHGRDGQDPPPARGSSGSGSLERSGRIDKVGKRRFSNVPMLKEYLTKKRDFLIFLVRNLQLIKQVRRLARLMRNTLALNVLGVKLLVGIFSYRNQIAVFVDQRHGVLTIRGSKHAVHDGHMFGRPVFAFSAPPPTVVRGSILSEVVPSYNGSAAMGTVELALHLHAMRIVHHAFLLEKEEDVMMMMTSHHLTSPEGLSLLDQQYRELLEMDTIIALLLKTGLSSRSWCEVEVERTRARLLRMSGRFRFRAGGADDDDDDGVGRGMIEGVNLFAEECFRSVSAWEVMK
ncbi:unnamed protein product [Zymoseptoria tritici ST99CH_3D1]|nr:unnamed protein product [Zymoseptoria tritici ST99CH_3D1]